MAHNSRPAERVADLQAVQASPGVRTAVLDRACAGDDWLRAEVEALLRAHDDAGDFLVESLPTPDDAGGSPTVVSGGAAPVLAGRYTLLRLLGSGGMGEVWEAEQSSPVRRRVAVKLVLGELTGGPA